GVARADSRAQEGRKGEPAGPFQVTVFRGRNDKKVEPVTPPPPPPPMPVVKEEQLVAAAISRGTLQVEGIPPGDLKALQRALRRLAKDTEGSKGIVDGDTEHPK